jgi:hypothetical protein
VNRIDLFAGARPEANMMQSRPLLIEAFVAAAGLSGRNRDAGASPTL